MLNIFIIILVTALLIFFYYWAFNPNRLRNHPQDVVDDVYVAFA